MARPWLGGLSWKIHSTSVPDAHGHIPRQAFPVWHNLYQPQVMAGPFMHCQILCMDHTPRNFRCSVFLSLLWEWKHRQILTAEVGKILFVENLVGEKRERLQIRECRGTQKLVILWARVGSGLYSLFLHCLRAEMPFKCKWAFPREEKYLLDLLWYVLQYVLHSKLILLL
jgi:hypothetical protein